MIQNIEYDRTTTCIHKAKWVVKNSSTCIENGAVKIVGGRIQAVGRLDSQETYVVDHGAGMILPALVNPHTHLELSAFKNRLPFEKGFKAWVQALIQLRDLTPEKELIQGIQEGIEALAQSGSSTIGEVSTLGLSRAPLFASSLFGVFFKEYLGNDMSDVPFPSESSALIDALAGHAPHTTSPQLLRQLKSVSRENRLPFSIHLAESQEEQQFIQTGKGPWADYLTERNIDYSDWPVPAAGSIFYLEKVGVLDSQTLAVHLLNVETKEAEILKNNGVHLCLCPRSNENLHGQLPDADLFDRCGLNLCLGTDSLASVSSLSLFDEMAFFRQKFSNIPPQKVFDMATINGAKALGMGETIGTLDTGKRALMIYVPESHLADLGLDFFYTNN